MTRNEEICNQANSIYKNIFRANAFIEGAHWADQNPASSLHKKLKLALEAMDWACQIYDAPVGLPAAKVYERLKTTLMAIRQT